MGGKKPKNAKNVNLVIIKCVANKGNRVDKSKHMSIYEHISTDTK